MYIKSYFFLTKLKKFFGKKPKDDFDWNLYHIHYKGEINRSEKNHTHILKKNEYIFSNNHLIKNKHILPLDPHLQLLYETILSLSPTSVLEFGCGIGDNCHNLLILIPSLEINGFDISKKQIKNLKRRHPSLKSNVTVENASKKNLQLQKKELVFSHAVLMHMRTSDGYDNALINLFNHSTKYVVLLEHWADQNFLEQIQKLQSENKIKWKQLYFYYKESEHLKGLYIMIISSMPLNFTPLTNYIILRDSHLKWSKYYSWHTKLQKNITSK